MKKLLFALFAAAALLPFSVSCDSGANEPDAPIPTDTLPPVTPPDQKPQGLDSIIIPEGLELVDYVPYTGPVEPLSDEIRPLLTDGKKWIVLYVYTDQRYNSAFADSVVDSHIHSDNGFEYKVVTRLPDYSFTRKDYLEVNGAVFGSYPSGSCLKRFDVNPKESISFPDTESHPSYSLTIVSRGKITLLGKERRAVKVWTGPKSLFATYDYWVEGIGPLYYTYRTTTSSYLYRVFGCPIWCLCNALTEMAS